jgi:hypothetical protein
MGDEMLVLCHKIGFAEAEIILDYAEKPRFVRMK